VRAKQPRIVMNNRLFRIPEAGFTGMGTAAISPKLDPKYGDFITPEQHIPATGMPGVENPPPASMRAQSFLPSTTSRNGSSMPAVQALNTWPRRLGGNSLMSTRRLTVKSSSGHGDTFRSLDLEADKAESLAYPSDFKRFSRYSRCQPDSIRFPGRKGQRVGKSWTQTEAVRQGKEIPGLGFLTEIVVIFLVGLLATNVFGSRLLRFIQDFLMRIPLVRNIYPAIKQIVETFSKATGSSFKKVVLVEYPQKGIFSLGFLTNEVQMNQAQGSGHFFSVYIPTNNLYLGQVALFRVEEVVFTDFTVEEGLKIILSGGTVLPPSIETQNSKSMA
jgi:uncharacterized membrane protein